MLDFDPKRTPEEELEDEELLEAMEVELERLYEKDDENEDQSASKEDTTKDEPFEFKKMMIFASPLKTKNASSVEQQCKNLSPTIISNKCRVSFSFLPK